MALTKTVLPKTYLNTRKLAYLEGIRGLAALMVVIHHYSLAFYPALASGNSNQTHYESLELAYYKSPLTFLTNGQFYVYIFFILSGYVLSKKFFKEKDMNYLASAFIRRLPRLNIPVAFSLVIAFILLKLSLNFNIKLSLITDSKWLASLNGDPSVINFLKTVFYKSLFYGDNSYNTVLWSISVEFFGSLMVFGLLALIYKSKNSFLILSFVLMVLILNKRPEYCTFILGMMLNYSSEYKLKNNVLKKIILSILLVLGLLLGSFPHVNEITTPTIKGSFFDFANYSFLISNNGLINAFGAFFVILSIQQSTKLQSFFSGKILAYLGYISFSMYLIHVLILQSFSSYFFLGLLNYLSYNTAFFFVFILSVSLIFLCSYVMTIYVDKKSLLFSQVFYEKYFKK